MIVCVHVCMHMMVWVGVGGLSSSTTYSLQLSESSLGKPGCCATLTFFISPHLCKVSATINSGVTYAWSHIANSNTILFLLLDLNYWRYYYYYNY